VAEPAVSPTHAAERFKRWLFGERIEQVRTGDQRVGGAPAPRSRPTKAANSLR